MIDRIYIPGMFVNLKHNLFLKLQFNPEEVTINKETTWDVEPILGYDYPRVVWNSGGPYTINLGDCFFDATRGASNGLHTILGGDLVGVLGIEAILETFMRPTIGSDESELAPLLKATGSDDLTAIHPPPYLYFIYGPRWYKCHLMSAPFRETLYNKLLIPIRVYASIELEVVESGGLHRSQETHREILAVGGSELQGISLFSPLVNKVLALDEMEGH